jgi:hypothetical protein
MNKIESIDKPFKGPIPTGTYNIFPKELSDSAIVGDILRQVKGDWGDWRVRLHPTSSLKTIDGKIINRDNFFLHGGWQEGSAGCIDIGGGISGNKNTNMIKDIILNSESDILVEVIK